MAGRLGRLAAVGITSATMAVGATAVATPATAAAGSDWLYESSRTYCYSGSWGQQCYRETTYRRNTAFCAKPAGSLTGGLLAWYSYCYKTVTVRR